MWSAITHETSKIMLKVKNYKKVAVNSVNYLSDRIIVF